MATDVNRTIEIYAAPTRLLMLLVFSMISTGMAAALVFRLLPNMPKDTGAESAAWSGLLFFGFCALVALWRLYTQRNPIVTLSPQGLRDTRVAAETIPWSAITSLSTWQMQRQMVMVVAVDPAAEQNLTLTRLARWTRDLNRKHGADGLVISTHGLRISFPALFYACRDYWEARHKM